MNRLTALKKTGRAFAREHHTPLMIAALVAGLLMLGHTHQTAGTVGLLFAGAMFCAGVFTGRRLSRADGDPSDDQARAELAEAALKVARAELARERGEVERLRAVCAEQEKVIAACTNEIDAHVQRWARGES